MKKAIVGVVALLGFGLLIGGNEAGDAKPKYTIKQVMAKAMKGKGYQKLEKDEQIDLFVALAANMPPMGDAASWKEKTTKLLAAAQSLEKGETDAAAKYKAALDCKACHSVHKPD